MSIKRKQYRPKFKAKIALAAIMDYPSEVRKILAKVQKIQNRYSYSKNAVGHI